MAKPKIAVFDIEVAPNLGYFFGAYDVTPIKMVEEFSLMSFAYLELGKKRVVTKARCDYKGDTDKELAHDLWAFFDKYDILIGHNVDRFDVKKSNSRFLYWKLDPPSHFRTIDTLKVIRKHFGEDKNGLDHFCQKHGITGKTDAKYHDLWYPCLQGDKKAWNKMKKYNAQDVVANTDMYELIRPWIDNHPNLATMLDDEDACPNCGENHWRSEGYRYAQSVKYKRLQCLECGARAKQQIKKDGSGGRITGK